MRLANNFILFINNKITEYTVVSLKCTITAQQFNEFNIAKLKENKILLIINV